MKISKIVLGLIFSTAAFNYPLNLDAAVKCKYQKTFPYSYDEIGSLLYLPKEKDNELAAEKIVGRLDDDGRLYVLSLTDLSIDEISMDQRIGLGHNHGYIFSNNYEMAVLSSESLNRKEEFFLNYFSISLKNKRATLINKINISSIVLGDGDYLKNMAVELGKKSGRVYVHARSYYPGGKSRLYVFDGIKKDSKLVATQTFPHQCLDFNDPTEKYGYLCGLGFFSIEELIKNGKSEQPVKLSYFEYIDKKQELSQRTFRPDYNLIFRNGKVHVVGETYIKYSGYIAREWFPEYLCSLDTNLSIASCKHDGIIADSRWPERFITSSDTRPMVVHDALLYNSYILPDQLSSFYGAIINSPTRTLFVRGYVNQQDSIVACKY